MWYLSRDVLALVAERLKAPVCKTGERFAPRQFESGRVLHSPAIRVRAEEGWLAQGYAVVMADVRGTGASFGQWYIPYSPHEAKDIGYLANWIGRQGWSNGKVVMTGPSYLGTTALMGPAYGEPAIKAIAPESADWTAAERPIPETRSNLQ
jgi:uncharacterized protein